MTVISGRLTVGAPMLDAGCTDSRSLMNRRYDTHVLDGHGRRAVAAELLARRRLRDLHVAGCHAAARAHRGLSRRGDCRRPRPPARPDGGLAAARSVPVTGNDPRRA